MSTGGWAGRSLSTSPLVLHQPSSGGQTRGLICVGKMVGRQGLHGRPRCPQLIKGRTTIPISERS